MKISRFDKEGLQRIEGLVAVPPARDRAASVEEPAQPVAARLTAEGMLEQAKSFLRSGWSIADSSDNPSGLPIYRSAAGRLYVLGRTMNVKFAPSASEDEIRSVLQDHHLEKKRSLGFAPNLMTVTADQNLGEDMYQISRSLSQHPAIEFAEPDVVEELGGRS